MNINKILDINYIDRDVKKQIDKEVKSYGFWVSISKNKKENSVSLCKRSRLVFTFKFKSFKEEYNQSKIQLYTLILINLFGKKIMVGQASYNVDEKLGNYLLEKNKLFSEILIREEVKASDTSGNPANIVYFTVSPKLSALVIEDLWKVYQNEKMTKGLMNE